MPVACDRARAAQACSSKPHRPHASGRAGLPAVTLRALPRRYLPGLQRAASPHRYDRCVQRAGDHRLWTDEVVRDLIDGLRCRRPAVALRPLAARIAEIGTTRPAIEYVDAGERKQLRCDFVAGCDGFHVIARAAIPSAALRTYERNVSIRVAWASSRRGADVRRARLQPARSRVCAVQHVVAEPLRAGTCNAIRTTQHRGIARRSHLARTEKRLATDDGWLPCRRTRSYRSA